MSSSPTPSSPSPSMKLVCVEKEKKNLVPGTTRVQNYWGDSGTVVWVGDLKGGHWGKGTYCAVQYDNPNPLNEKRSDGVFNGVRHCTTPAHTCDFNPLRHLYFEVNPLVISHFRTKYGEKVARFHDFELIKIAIARHFDVDLMDKTLEEHLEWYETYNPDPSKEWFHSKVTQYFPHGFPEAWDREGNLLHFSRPGLGGEISPADVLKLIGVDALLRNCTIQHEEMKNKLRERGFEHHRRFTSIYDLKDLGSVDGKTMEFAKGLAEINKNHQLEIVNKIIMINAPFFFRMIFAAISVFMDERTKDKVVVLSSDFQGELTKHVDPKYWPTFASGTNDEWLARAGRVGQPPPEEDPPVTHGLLGEAEYNMHNLFPEEKKKREKAAAAAEKATKS